MPMGMAPAAYILWTRFLRHNPKNPKWPNRDRFVLSAGHGSMLLYSLLYLTGYEDYPLEQLKSFRQWGSLTPGHPESELTADIETTTLSGRALPMVSAWLLAPRSWAHASTRAGRTFLTITFMPSYRTAISWRVLRRRRLHWPVI